MLDAVDLFAGPGGWDVAARDLGLNVLGFERDCAACETRRAAGLPTVEGDVRDYGPGDASARGFIASPPCQTFSTAGKGAGRCALSTVPELVAQVAVTGDHPDPGSFDDERTALVLEPLRWVVRAHQLGAPYEWIALEQVPTVLPVWEAYAEHFRALGYHVVTGNVQAEQYGVPQTRKRAVLVARLGQPVELPAPTHAVPVSMADAGIGPEGNEMRSNYSGGPVDPVTGKRGRGVRPRSAPGFTVTSKRHRWIPADRSLSVEEAAALQTFPPDHPWRGSVGEKYQQVGNAIPPLLARAILEAVS